MLDPDEPSRTGRRPPARPVLTPTQAAAFDALLAARRSADVLVLGGAPASGKTTVLRALHEALGGDWIDAADILRTITEGPPDKIEESLFSRLALQDSRNLFLDDMGQCIRVGAFTFADRPLYLAELFRALFAACREKGVQLFAVGYSIKGVGLGDPAQAYVEIGKPVRDDYAHLLSGVLEGAPNTVDIDLLFSSYGDLRPHQLISAGRSLVQRGKSFSTADVIQTLERSGVRSNLQLTDNERTSVGRLVGLEAIETELRRTVLLPLLRPDLASDLGLRPKRGILLHGPPGTGKTTIGRYLADKVGAKFFLIDGTFIPGDGDFMSRLQGVLAAARSNSPSVVFVDDADVLFRNGMAAGLARKFLSMMDGLVSEGESHVCYVMTAMDIGDMPPALIRSGRLEVWLQTKAPTGEGRLAMIRQFATDLSDGLDPKVQERIVEATEGFTPADLKALVGDARSLLAFDTHRGRPVCDLPEYLVAAAAEIRQRKQVLDGLAV